MAQVPHGPKDFICPLHKKSMDKVCHKCPMWVQISMEQHPQDNKKGINDWNCAFAWGPIMAVKMSNHIVQMTSETHEMRNEAKKAHDDQVTMGAIAVQRSSAAIKEVLVDLSREPLLPFMDDQKLIAAE